jgi:outer membrane receptor protein involved in Fe transport
VVGIAGSTLTDAGGRFTWAPAPVHPFQVVVTIPGRRTGRPLTVDAAGAMPATIVVTEAVDEAVTVLGASPGVHWSPAAATTVVGGAQTAERRAEHLAQALETVPGTGRISAGHAAVPAVRGLARGRTLILIDGARVAAERRAGPSATFLDPAIVEQVEVARGPASVAYGSDAFGGVIAVRTRQAEPGAALRGRVVATAGAGVPERGASLELSKGLARGGVLAQAHARTAGDYDGPDGTVLDSGWADRGLLLSATHAVGHGLVAVAWQADVATDVGRPRSDSHAVRFVYPFERSRRLTGSYQTPDAGGLGRVSVTAFWGTSSQRTDQDRAATAAGARRIERAEVSAADFQVRGSVERDAGPARLVAGIDVHGRAGLHATDVRLTFDAAGAVADEHAFVSVDRAGRTATGAFLQLDAPLGGHVRLAGGLRGDRVVARNEGGYFGDRAAAHAALSGSVALTIAPIERLAVTAQASRGFRDPALSDRFFRGPSGRGFITGTPDLSPETSRQLDLAARYTVAGTLQAAFYLYRYDIDDLVERYEERADAFAFRNRARARLQGIEAEVQGSLPGGWTLGVGADLARGRVRGVAASLDDVAAPSVSVSGRKVFAGGHAAFARAAWCPRDDRPGPTEIATPGAALVDAGASIRAGAGLELRAAVRNALDARYPASPDPRWVQAPGRSLSLAVLVHF